MSRLRTDLLSDASYGKSSCMRQWLPRASACLIFFVGVSFLAPAFQCGGLSTTSTEMAECCRAMGSACRKTQGNGACCKHQVSELSPTVGLLPCACVSAVQPPVCVAFLPVATGDLTARPSYRFFALSVAHSPPERAPLFLLHCALLI